MASYIEITESAVPRCIRFDVLRVDQGQIVEVAWGTFSRYEAGPGDPYKRVIDQSYPSGHPSRVRFFKRAALR